MPHPEVSGPQSGRVGSRFTLNGSGSFDGPTPNRSEGHPLVFNWSIVREPAASAITTASFSVNHPSAATTTQTPRDPNARPILW